MSRTLNSYMSQLEATIKDGEWKDNRTGVRCLTNTPQFFKHDMREGFPLLTQKFVSLRLVAVELEAFIFGITDKNWFAERKCNIWREWGNPKTTQLSPLLDGLEVGSEDYKIAYKQAQLENNDLGRIYGWQWRRYGQPYPGPNSEKLAPHSKPYDQLNNVIETLKTNPNDRRLVVTAWNPLELDSMALPACHLMFIFQHINGKLSLNWIQRSCDSFLGVPFNIASYALLLELVAKEVNLIPHMLTGNLVDFHIYENHIEQVNEMIARESFPLPEIKFTHDNFWNWDHTKVECINYQHGGKLSAEVSV